MQGNQDSSASGAIDFWRTVAPLVKSGDICTAEQTVRRCWPQSKLIEFLTGADERISHLAIMALGCAGDCGAIEPLSHKLRDENPELVRAAEHALWSIWLRAGQPKGLRYLKCGCEHLKHGNHETAIEKFTLAIAEDPDFAEAFNQRAIAYYLSGQYEKSIADCHRVLAKIPVHFGAMAGMGHCHAQLNQLENARDCYQAALRIHPGMEGIADSLRSVEAILGNKGA